MSLLGKVMPNDALSLKILEQRALLLAAESVDTVTVDTMMMHYICFKLHNRECYGLPYSDVAEVMTINKITAVPMAPKFIDGLIYWHGKLVSVIDLAAYFNIKNDENSDNSKTIAIVSHEKAIIGLKFNDVTGVDAYSDDQLDKNLAMNASVRDKYVHGIHRGRVTILNSQQIISDITDALIKQRGML